MLMMPLDAVTVIREELGIRSPDSELKLGGAAVDVHGARYMLAQLHNGMPVYGRRVIVSANAEGKGNFVMSDFVESAVLDGEGLEAGISQAQAEAAAKTNYSADVECDSVEVIYSFGEY